LPNPKRANELTPGPRAEVRCRPGTSTPSFTAVATMHVVLSGKVNAPPPLVGDEADVVAIEHGARAPYSGEPVDKMQEVVKFCGTRLLILN
jgi:hypothetical protein